VKAYWGDQFGRVVDQKWQSTTGTIDRFRYGYDGASNRTWRENTVARDASKALDQYYTYDGLQRLVTSQTGTLVGSPTYTGIGGTPAEQEAWTLDCLGNWTNYAVTTSGTTATQTRVHNMANELTQINTSSANVAHDAAGNMTTVPLTASPTSGHITCTYDAWNRLVTASGSTGTIPQARYFYDGLGRRIAKAALSPTNSYDRTDFYYNENWQVLEEQKAPGYASLATATSATPTAPYAQYVWDLRYIDAPVCRWRSSSTNSPGALDECLYYCNDANMNVTALVNSATGSVVERYMYDPYGKPTFCGDAWQNPTTTSAYDNEVLFGGYRWDSEIGQYQARYRYHHPTLGRWATRDPSGPSDGNNLYQYAASSPYLRSDPQGLKSEVRVDTGNHEIVIKMYVHYIVSDCDRVVRVFSKEMQREVAEMQAESAHSEAVSRLNQLFAIHQVIVPRVDGRQYEKYGIRFEQEYDWSLDHWPLDPTQNRNVYAHVIHYNYPKPGYNQVLLTSNWKGLCTTHWYAHPFRSEDDAVGIWFLETPGRAVAHETMHMLGLEDHYNRVTKISDPGYSHNLMGISAAPNLKQGQVLYVLREFFDLGSVLGDFKVAAIGSEGHVISSAEGRSIMWGGGELTFNYASGWYNTLEGPSQ
jgi:RHS repeat-associated protein